MDQDFNILWLQAGSCGGCTMSGFSADDVGLGPALARFGILFLWHPALSAQSDQDVMDIIDDILNDKQHLDALCVEGSIMRGPQNTGRFQIMSGTDQPMMDVIKALSHKAKHVIAVGSCASFGGIPSLGADLTQACGLQYEDNVFGGLLGTSAPRVTNIAGCPPHPGWITETLAQLAMGEELELDSFGRPRAFADHLAHHGCGRNEFYEFKASAADHSHRGCLMENLGCKATQAPGDCNIRRWNGHGSCTDAGYACIACTVPGFQAPGSPYLETPKVAGIPVGLPVDMPKAWFVALAALSKSATPKRVRENAHASHVVEPPAKAKR